MEENCQNSNDTVLDVNIQAIKSCIFEEIRDALLHKECECEDIDYSEIQFGLDQACAEEYFCRGADKYANGDVMDAIEDYDRATTLDSEFAEAYYNRALCKAEKGDKTGALEDYDKAIEFNSDIYQAYYNRGIVKNEIGDKNGAVADYDRTIELNPDFVEAYINRGNVKSAIGDKTGAVKDYNKAMEMNPNHEFASNNMAECLCSMGKYETALHYVNYSLELSQTDYALDTRGVIYTGLSRFDEALADFNKAIEMEPADAVYYEHRAALYRKMAEQQENPAKKVDLSKRAEDDEIRTKELKKLTK